MAFPKERGDEEMLLHEDESLRKRLSKVVCGCSSGDRRDQANVMHMGHVDPIDEENGQQNTSCHDQNVPASLEYQRNGTLNLSDSPQAGTYPNLKFS